MNYKETQYGFEFGAANIERCMSHEKQGWVILTLKTPRHKNGIQLYVTKTGKVRVYGEDGKEWEPNRSRDRHNDGP